MKITKLYTYPIKSLRATSLDSAEVTRHGFKYDRRFMILQVLKDNDGGTTYKNMHVADYPKMVLFSTALYPPSEYGTRDGRITVTFKPPQGEEKTLQVPLEPETDSLEKIEVVMHRSPTKAYKMPQEQNEWLSSCFGYDVILAYLGEHHRAVLMTTNSRDSSSQQQQQPSSTGWLSSITNTATSFLTGANSDSSQKEITFADCAPYLIVSDKSMDDVHHRLSDGQEMDITKFRPNVIISGAEEPWEEDFWGELTIGEGEERTVLECAQNCGRCKSINIDYSTGKPGTTDAGKMLAKLQSNRRVDAGTKYSPVFGRYSFLLLGHAIKVGDEVVVSRRNTERTRFDWQGLCTT